MSRTFEIELLDFVSKDDLFSDGGVIKLLKKEGSGWRMPKALSELKIEMKVDRAGKLEDKGAFDYILGSKTLGELTKAVEKALSGMKKGEECSLTCSKDYGASVGL